LTLPLKLGWWLARHLGDTAECFDRVRATKREKPAELEGINPSFAALDLRDHAVRHIELECEFSLRKTRLTTRSD